MMNKLAVVALSLPVAACLSEPPDAVDVSETTSDLVISHGCTITVDLHDLSTPQGVTIPTSFYSSRNCELFTFDVIAGQRSWRAFIYWSGMALDNETDCRNSSTFSIFTRLEPVQQYLGSDVSTGIWHTDYVQNPIPYLPPLQYTSCRAPGGELSPNSWGIGATKVYELTVAGITSGHGPQGFHISFQPVS